MMNAELVANILRKGKALAPDKFPALPRGRDAESVREAQQMLADWGEALGTACLPWQIWNDAVVLWATQRVGDRMVTPQDLIGAAKVVRDRWETDPSRKPILDAYRVEVRNGNYRRMGLESVSVADLPSGAGTSFDGAAAGGRLVALAEAWAAP